MCEEATLIIFRMPVCHSLHPVVGSPPSAPNAGYPQGEEKQVLRRPGQGQQEESRRQSILPVKYLIPEQGAQSLQNSKLSNCFYLTFNLLVLSSIQLINMCLLSSLLGPGNTTLIPKVPALTKFGV